MLLASVFGSVAFVVPVLADETYTDPQQQTVETSSVDDASNVSNEEVVVVKNTFQEIDGYTYYFDNDGNKVIGIQSINGDVYYFDTNGILQTNVEYGEYYFGQDGKAVKNDWVSLSTGTKYYDENGLIVKSTSESVVMKEIGGTKYYFDHNGVLLDNYTDENKLDTVVIKKNTWAQDNNGNRYYYDENGIIVTNRFYDIDGNTYHFNSLGHLDIGVFLADHQLYISNNDGCVQKKQGWQYYGFEWYYVSNDGTLVKNEWITDNEKNITLCRMDVLQHLHQWKLMESHIVLIQMEL